MIELVSLVFFLVGLGLLMGLHRFFIKATGTPHTNYSQILSAILFLFIWNSEYVASSILVFALFFLLRSNEHTQNEITLKLILTNLLYIMTFSFIFRKLKDVGLQSLNEILLQNIK